MVVSHLAQKHVKLFVLGFISPIIDSIIIWSNTFEVIPRTLFTLCQTDSGIGPHVQYKAMAQSVGSATLSLGAGFAVRRCCLALVWSVWYRFAYTHSSPNVPMKQVERLKVYGEETTLFVVECRTGGADISAGSKQRWELATE